jgi:predicted transcriptional regulator
MSNTDYSLACERGDHDGCDAGRKCACWCHNAADLDSAILRELQSLPAEHTTGLAEAVNAPRSTVRRHLEDMERRGLVAGVKHDERNTGGRIRIYWSQTIASRDSETP